MCTGFCMHASHSRPISGDSSLHDPPMSCRKHDPVISCPQANGRLEISSTGNPLLEYYFQVTRAYVNGWAPPHMITHTGHSLGPGQA